MDKKNEEILPAISRHSSNLLIPTKAPVYSECYASPLLFIKDYFSDGSSIYNNRNLTRRNSLMASPTQSHRHSQNEIGRNWNEEYQSLYETPALSLAQIKQRESKLSQLLRTFCTEAEAIATKIMQEYNMNGKLLVPKPQYHPITTKGLAGGVKFLINNIFYKFSIDQAGIYEGRLDWAQKAAALEIKGMNAVLAAGLDLIHLHPTLTASIRRGRLVIIASAKAPIDSSSLVCCDNAGHNHNRRVISEASWSIMSLVANLADSLHLSPHFVKDGKGKVHRLMLPIDVEIHQSQVDGRLYVCDLARLLPSTPPIYHAVSDKGARGSVACEYLFHCFRREALSQARSSGLAIPYLVGDAFSPFIFDKDGFDSKGPAHKLWAFVCQIQVPKAAQALLTQHQVLKEESLNVFFKAINIRAEAGVSLPKSVNTAALTNSVPLPNTFTGTITMARKAISDTLHFYGVNMRLLPMVLVKVFEHEHSRGSKRSLWDSPLLLVLIIEMLCRGLKPQVLSFLQQAQQAPTAEERKKENVSFQRSLYRLFSQLVLADKSYWEKFFKVDLVDKFGLYCSHSLVKMILPEWLNFHKNTFNYYKKGLSLLLVLWLMNATHLHVKPDHLLKVYLLVHENLSPSRTHDPVNENVIIWRMKKQVRTIFIPSFTSLDQQEKQLQEALALRSNILGQNSPGLLHNLWALVNLYQMWRNEVEDVNSFFQRVRDVTEHIAKCMGEASVNGMLESCVRIRGATFDEHAVADKLEAVDRICTLFTHFGHAREAKDMYDKALKMEEKDYGHEHLITARTIENLCSLLSYLGEYEAASTMYERALAIKEKHYGSDHVETAVTIRNLGGVHRNMGDYEGAKSMHEKALAIEEKHYGPDHVGTAVTIENLGLVLSKMGDHQAAKSSFEKALKIKEKHYGPNHPETAITTENLGIVLSKMGDYHAANTMYERTLAVKEKYYGVDDVETAITIRNLGTVRRNTGDYQGAKMMYEKALQIAVKHYGPHHVNIAMLIESLGHVLSDFGDYQKAEDTFKNALKIEEMHYGAEHVKTAGTLENLGSVLSNAGDYQGARRMYERALAIKQKQYGADHIETAIIIDNLAYVLSEMGHDHRAKEMYGRALVIKQKHYGLDHLETAVTTENLGLIRCKMGDYSAAKGILEKALKMKEKHYGSDHVETAVTIRNLGGVHRNMGDYEGAKSMHEKALAIEEKHYGPDHVGTAVTIENLGLVLSKMGDHQAAKSSFEKALKIKEKHYGPNHPETAITTENLGIVLSKMGDYHAANTMYERTLAVKEKYYGPENANTVTTMQNLALVLANMDDHRRARNVFERVLAITEKHYGQCHIETAIIMDNLAYSLSRIGDEHAAGFMYEKSLAIKQTYYGPDHIEIAKSKYNLALLYRDQRHHQLAKSLLSSILNIFIRHLGPGHRTVRMVRDLLDNYDKTTQNAPRHQYRSKKL